MYGVGTDSTRKKVEKISIDHSLTHSLTGRFHSIIIPLQAGRSISKVAQLA